MAAKNMQCPVCGEQIEVDCVALVEQVVAAWPELLDTRQLSRIVSDQAHWQHAVERPRDEAFLSACGIRPW
jgi:hypothetical protein